MARRQREETARLHGGAATARSRGAIGRLPHGSLASVLASWKDCRHHGTPPPSSPRGGVGNSVARFLRPCIPSRREVGTSHRHPPAPIQRDRILGS
ncbi:hypothetical protein GQ55_9G304900 [Panicum hallii var. hallii]|uniref:Uncharacterized protein n=1 Tax=Panicum hallii var. hallii TaxID=1504633 RepID=A0A2T7C7T1_9POAL|nr:hypothetical protein GQ55_9G304900 [Panicum hallii var. hallii]